MKKVILTVTMLLLMALSTAVAYGTELDEDVYARYITAARVKTELDINGGKASYYALVYPMTEKSIDYIRATITLVKGTGTTVTSTTKTIYLNDNFFKVSDSKSYLKSGTYHVEYILKVYKSGVLKETIKGKSSEVKY